ncbi:hypothetical protein [Paenibacillus sp. HJGM_3]|uniref:hypothetical protein n=1 Tax=Paenibacillus sp. HJGM_3 TaxID=3379816 RepID=UPI00385DB384
MATPALHDMKLVGSTSSAGGQFRNIKITGDCAMSSDVTADSFHLTGEVAVQGQLSVQLLKMTGQCRVSGAIRADRIQGVGELSAESIRGGQVKLSGHIRTEHSCEAETLKLLGWIEVGELINAESLTLDLHGRCRAQEIGGGTIIVKRSSLTKISNLFSMKEPGTLKAELIEGDVVHLEHVTADIVRGARVTLGPGCKIGRVEYREALERHPKSEIGTEVRI